MKLPALSLSNKTTVSVLRLNGVIATGGRFSGGVLNDQGLAPMIERAFTRGKPRAVALSINSPGGSPVQSSLIAARIRRLAEEKDIPVYAFCEDVAASGGYWLASAADEIVVDPASIIGSIGVISAGFGFQDLIERHGVERRVYTAGRSKSFLDPFKPEKEDDVARLRRLHEQLHQVFIDQVTSRRGSKLAQNDDLFTGAFWIGSEAVELGLADRVGHLVPRMQELFGEKVRFNVMAPRRSMMQRLGAPGAADLVGAIEDRAVWARYGL